ncbi:MAG: DNA primase [Phycisphaeraceae bacterium]|nr:MAG: DNA primase [Phycisphaeraceae bacterium]
MPGFDDDKLRVLEASDIAEVIGEYVKLVPKGREFACLCPFHDDHHPSMYVVPHKRMFHCFVCGAGGDVFTFMQRYHGVEFPEAMRMLAERAGIELTPWKPEARPGGVRATRDEPRLSRADLIEANRAALSFFRAILRDHPSGAAARALVERRGIAPEMVERFEIGASPDRWDGLVQTIRSKNLRDAAFLATGLIKRGDRPEPYDALRNRLIFPIHGETGEPIAFGGRRVNDEEEPKYLNSPETPLFSKSKVLFGLPMARDRIRKAQRAVVVEGYTDVIACHQAGLTNVVGTLGTAFTSGHAQKLRGQCSEIVLLFDGDDAGQAAADRAIEVLFGARVDIRVAMLTGIGAKDPDELLGRPGGSDKLNAILDGAEPVIERWARRVRERQADMGPAMRARFLDDQVARLAESGLATLSAIERDSMLASLASALGVPSRVMADTFARAQRPGRRDAGERRESAGPPQLRPVDRFRLHLLSGLLDGGGIGQIAPDRLVRALRVDLAGAPGAIAAVTERACGMIERREALDAAALLAVIDSPEASALVAGGLAADRAGAGTTEADLLAGVERLEAHALLAAGAEPKGARIGAGSVGAAGGEGGAMADRLARLRELHAGHGGNREANPYRFKGRVGGPESIDRRESVQGAERSEDGEDEAHDAGAAPGPR